jgi:hypothetical protein
LSDGIKVSVAFVSTSAILFLVVAVVVIVRVTTKTASGILGEGQKAKAPMRGIFL